MIIKIQNPHCSSPYHRTYTLIDSVTDITHFSVEPQRFHDYESIEKFLKTPHNDELVDGWSDHTLVDFDEIMDMKQRKLLEEGNAQYSINWIAFNRSDGNSYYYAFDTVAYISNDNGKTLEKLYGGGFASGKKDTPTKLLKEEVNKAISQIEKGDFEEVEDFD